MGAQLLASPAALGLGQGMEVLAQVVDPAWWDAVCAGTELGCSCNPWRGLAFWPVELATFCLATHLHGAPRGDREGSWSQVQPVTQRTILSLPEDQPKPWL